LANTVRIGHQFKSVSETGLVILVVDGVSDSGRVVCQRLAKLGHTVFSGYEPTDAEDTIHADGVKAVALDVCCDNSVAIAIKQVTKKNHRIDIVVNNLRAPLFGAIEAVHIDSAERYVHKMLIGTARLQNAVLPLMRAQGCGRIINFNSRCETVHGSFTGWQSAVVAALDKMGAVLNEELAGSGVAIINQQTCLFNVQSKRPYLSEKDHKLASIDDADVTAFNRKIQRETTVASTVHDEASMMMDAILGARKRPASPKLANKPDSRKMQVWRGVLGGKS